MFILYKMLHTSYTYSYITQKNVLHRNIIHSYIAQYLLHRNYCTVPGQVLFPHRLTTTKHITFKGANQKWLQIWQMTISCTLLAFHHWWSILNALINLPLPGVFFCNNFWIALTAAMLSLYNSGLLFCLKFYFYHIISCYDWLIVTEFLWGVPCPLGFLEICYTLVWNLDHDSIVWQHHEIVVPKFIIILTFYSKHSHFPELSV